MAKGEKNMSWSEAYESTVIADRESVDKTRDVALEVERQKDAVRKEAENKQTLTSGTQPSQ
jgi:hypothetical protein